MPRSCPALLLVASIALFAVIRPSMATVAAPLRILLLHPTDLLMPSTVEQDRITRKALSAALARPLEFYSQGSDETVFAGRTGEPEILDVLPTRFAARRPDLVVFHGPMHDIVSRNRDELWPGVPIMFVGVQADRLSDPSFPQDVPGTAIRFDLPATVQLALQLQPDARRLIVLTGSSSYDRTWQERAHRELTGFRKRLSVEIIGDRTLGELGRLVAALDAETIVLVASMFRDSVGHYYTTPEAVHRLAGHSGAPIYVLAHAAFGGGAAGGFLVDWNAQSAAIGDIARRLLAGESARTIGRSAVLSPVCRVDLRSLRHWDIPLRRVPENCEVWYRPPSLWVQYRTQAILIAVIILAQAALIVALLMLRHVRRKAELEAERQRVELAHAARLATVGELSASIAHEISQPLFAIQVNAATGETLLAAERPSLAELKRLLAEIRRDDERATDVIRKLRELLSKRPSEMQLLHVNDVITGILSFIAGTTRHREVTVYTALTPELPPICGDRVQLEQVLMNLLMNAFDAMAEIPPVQRRLTVSTSTTEEGCVEVAVSDNGPGIPQALLGQLFDPFFSTKREGMGLGLSIAQSIVHAHRGCLWVESSTSGATFRFAIPPAAACPVVVYAAEEEVAA
jgi:signal transduction histidine kinase